MYSVPRGCPGRAIFGRGSLYPSGGDGAGDGGGGQPLARPHAVWCLFEGHGLVDGGLPEVTSLRQSRTQGAGAGGAEGVVSDETALVLRFAEGRGGDGGGEGGGEANYRPQTRPQTAPRGQV